MLFVLATFFCGMLCFFVENHQVDFSLLEKQGLFKPTIVFDKHGLEIMRFQRDRRNPVSYEKLPVCLINAFIAAEDWNFFYHNGISFKGIVRSILVNLYFGGKRQGASTITQQLVKLLFVGTERTFARKIKEQLYALAIERHYTKEQILQTYLNNVYFGSGIYGVAAAAQRFWSKHVWELTVDEAATLAGIVQSPNKLCPLFYPLSAQQRRNIILLKMKKLGFLSEELYAVAKETLVCVDTSARRSVAPHFRELIRQFVENEWGKEALYDHGFSIQTTLDFAIQAKAEAVFYEQITALRESLKMAVDGALVCLDNESGGITALVGGYDFWTSQFNRAFQAHRQIGSIIKPFIYAVALQQKKSFLQTYIDEPIAISYDRVNWKPRNYDRTFRGEMTLASALSRSNNILTIKLLLEIGIDPVIAMIEKMGLAYGLAPYPSLALGCIDAPLITVASCFSIFARKGMMTKPYYIEWVKDRWGKKIWKERIATQQIFPEIITDQVASVLQISLDRIKKMRDSNDWINSEAISKTGTTNDSRTCWFIGSTPELTTAVYVGCDDNRPMGENVYPVKTAFPIWSAFHRQIPAHKKQFLWHPSLERVFVNERTGVRSQAGASDVISLLIP